MREIDKLKGLVGRKIVDINIQWNDILDDYCIKSITLGDDAVLELWAQSDCVVFATEKWEGNLPS